MDLTVIRMVCVGLALALGAVILLRRRRGAE